MDPGLYHISGDEYRADHKSYSKSNLVDFEISPLNMIHKRLNPETKEAWALGSATHTLILEGERWHDDVAVVENKRGKAWKEFQIANAGKTIITQAQEDAVYGMARSLCQNPIARDLLLPGESECSLFFKIWFELQPLIGSQVPIFRLLDDPYDHKNMEPEYLHSITLKVRPDNLTDTYITDLKTSAVITPKAFGRAAFNFHYGWSAYLTKLAVEAYFQQDFDYVFVVVQSAPPYDVAMFDTPNEILDMAQENLRPLLEDLARCDYLGEWPGQKQQIQILEYPGWAYAQHARALLDSASIF